MSRYFLIVLVIFGCVLNGMAQKKPVPMPVIDCVVEYAHGWFDSYGSMRSGDTISLDLNAVDKIGLDFKSKNPEATGPGYIGQPGRFRVEGDTKPDWSVMKLVASQPGRRMTINIRRLDASEQYDIIIINESMDVGIVVMKGTVREQSGEGESN